MTLLTENHVPATISGVTGQEYSPAFFNTLPQDTRYDSNVHTYGTKGTA